ncbi:hypothetical protein [Cumulibacter soli]|uniref:hypothetical protein n=1 Tax=Cumulibacter soli TaxID=2546344 RepID=UPI00106812B2|nr:hypothetical protein [Cumulibacter soli]
MGGGLRKPLAGRPGPRGITSTQLRSMWRSASQERGWGYPDDWWTPAVDAVAEAIVTDGDVAERCTRLGLARARAGVSLGETLDDVLAIARLTRALHAHPAYTYSTPPRPIEVVNLLKSAAIGWADGEATVRDLQDVGTGTLPGVDYLSERLREVTAEAEFAGEHLGDRYALVVATLLQPGNTRADPLDVQSRIDAWDRTWQMSQLADDLRTAFCAGESIVRIGPSAAVVLARRTPELTTRVAGLRSLLSERADWAARTDQPVRTGQTERTDQTARPDRPARIDQTARTDQTGRAGARIWVERLPNSLQHAVELLTDLRR